LGHALISSHADLERRVTRLLAMPAHPPHEQKFDFVFSSIAALLTIALSIV